MKGFPVRGDRVTDGDRMLHKVPRITVEEPMREHVPGDAEKAVREAPYRACDDAGPAALELFFPLSDATPADRRQIAVAKMYCRRCPVQKACLEFAMRSLPNGIAGGMTEWERRDKRRRWAG